MQESPKVLCQLYEFYISNILPKLLWIGILPCGNAQKYQFMGKPIQKKSKKLSFFHLLICMALKIRNGELVFSI